MSGLSSSEGSGSVPSEGAVPQGLVPLGCTGPESWGVNLPGEPSVTLGKFLAALANSKKLKESILILQVSP